MATLTQSPPVPAPDALMTDAARKVAALGMTSGFVRRIGVTYQEGGFPELAAAIDEVNAEGWTGSGSCSKCWQNHAGSGRCSCSCHVRDAVPAPRAA